MNELNINNETFSKAYKCLYEANLRLESGLGNFNELDKNSLSLINQSNIANNDRIDFMNDECSDLRTRMYNTIQGLAKMNEEAATYFNDILSNAFLEEFGDFLNGVSFDSSVFYDETFVNNLMAEINAALLADDKDGEWAREVVEIKLMENGAPGVHTMGDTLYVKLSSGHKYYINIKGKVNSDSMVHVIHQGAYETNGYSKLDGYYKNHCDDVDNGIFIRMIGACGTAGISEELDANSSVVKTISDTFSIPFNNTIVEGFSGAQASVMRIAADIARETGKAPAGVSLVECHTKPHPWSEEDAQALNDVNAVVYAVYGNGDGNGSATKKVFTEWGQKYTGINMVYIDAQKGGHENIFNEYLNSDMLGFLSNNTEFPSEYYASATKEIFDVNTNSWVSYDLSGKKTNDVFVNLANNNYWSGIDSGVKTDPVVLGDVEITDSDAEIVPDGEQSVVLDGQYNGEILSAGAGRIYYTRSDGVNIEESWCGIDLENSKELDDFYKYDGDKVINGVKISDMKYWVREDGAQMIGDYVAVATTVIPRRAYGINDGMSNVRSDWEGGNHNYGDIVETSHGLGIVMGRCGYAYGALDDGNQNYEIYTLWSTDYSSKVYADDYVPTNYAHDPKLENGGQTVIKATPTYEKNGILENWASYVNPMEGTQSTQTKPSAPVEPEAQKPTEPSAPVEPETKKPTEPSAPVEPEVQKPTEPSVPVEPEAQKPTEPSAPVEPETQKPIEPSVPVEPEAQKPTEPSAPVEPETQKPTEPSAPVEPETQKPIEPSAPVEPEAQKPTEPSVPVEPEAQKPTEPSAPVEPEVQKTMGSNSSTDLGDSSTSNGNKIIIPGILASGLAFLAGGIAKIIKNKKKNNDI